jgi:hypothetical protein
MSPFINKRSDVQADPQQKGPRQMNTSEEIANLRKDSALWDLKNPRHAEATARLTALYKELYGDSVEEDNTR